MKTLNDRESRLRKSDIAARGGSGRRRRCEAKATRSDGVVKRSYTSHGVAKRAAQQMSEQHLVPIYVYRCPGCGQWHLTTSEQTRTAPASGSAV